MLLLHEHTGHAGKIGQRVQERPPLAVEHVDAVGAGMGDVHPAAGAVDVGVIEAGLRARRQRDEADSPEAQSLPTSCLHQA